MSHKPSTLGEILARFTAKGELYEKLPDRKVRCLACAHRCVIFPGKQGICKVRFNDQGVLRVPFGYTAGIQIDPIEKKPLFHVLPGTDILTFGMLGCNFHCPFCQNWITSQALRDPVAGTVPQPVTAQAMIQLALKYGARAVASSYNEPLITAEWAVAVFKEAKKYGLKTAFVSNGYATPEVLEYLRPHLDAWNIDLKTFQDKNYRWLGGTLKPVLETIQRVHEMGFWLEVTTLLVPGWNDSEEEIRQIARFLVSVSPDIPWHITAYHRDYRMTEGPESTPPSALLRAAEIGREEGVKFIYLGNLPGLVKTYENTYCPRCGALLIERIGYRILRQEIGPDGRCPHCGEPIPGIWH